ncbi:hypothetical protein PR202_ga28473 [Eleusine coracana subsp. coracana]|uniref:Uncharacterized protein n=1 Tax=Eleusine coracana subsp. coracana TaxID=191504 RepID=A0AAV5DIT6_ELECO|nr:hypothetical protein PR202_ga28473 [Eleusine coracana subsp. coracana]
MYHRRGVLAFARRRRRWLIYAGAAAGAVLIYRHPAVAAHRRRLARLAAALASLAAAAAAVASDLAAFLRSDSDAVPQTLKQISKLRRVPRGDRVRVRALRGGRHRRAPRMLSPSGERLASAAAGSFGRELVLSFYSTPSQPSTDSTAATWVDLLTTRKSQRAIRSWVEVFTATATAVGVFIDKTIHINTYDQLFVAATNPAYDARLQELFVALCNASVETLVKTSHSVLSNANSPGGNDSVTGTCGSNGGVCERWVETVSSALAVPSNRKLVLDLTGKATFEAVRSFLEFVLWKLHAGVRAGGDATVGAGLRALRYTSERSIIIATICIALCLHVLNGTWLAVPS